ncbi:nucleotidyl transferase AbiEii/AbiGii toxin family protein [Streptomyces sp900105755]|uniref:nucleotidyl transferase AbiEii/AbiGii toxin family protein n=1 Tax=Streptomyces sp. 900105755 TaxID=3154389 RepID=UPI0033263ADE
MEYVLERFLQRPASSPLGREHFVLKGGLLLAQFGARRMTRDIDILGHSSPGTETEIIRRVTPIADRRRRRIRSHDTQDGPHPRGGRGRPGSTTHMTDPARARHTISLLMQI